MPLDRRITIRIAPAQGDAVDYAVWATRTDKVLTTIADGGYPVLRTIRRRDFRVRWFSVLAEADPTEVTLTDDQGNTLNVDNLVEVTQEGRTRRRWIDIEGIAPA